MTPIVERSEEGKRAYRQGYEAGWKWALDGIRRGLSVDEVEESCLAVMGLLVVPPTEEDPMSLEPLGPLPSRTWPG